MNYAVLIYLTHILLFAPILIYIWYATVIKKQKISDNFAILCLALAGGVIVYHGYKLIKILFVK